MRIHVDTDFGGDPDDAAAVAMLLAWPDVEVVAVTTTLEVAGRRAGCLGYYLGLVGRTNIPVAAGAEASLTTGRHYEPTWGDTRYWPAPVVARPSPPGAAVELLAASIDKGATILTIGGFTNLAILETMRPGSLEGVQVVAMAGWCDDLGAGYPPWDASRDFNTQCDTRAAAIVAAVADLTLVPLPVAITAQLCERDLPRLRASGPVGALLARQSQAHAQDSGKARLGRQFKALADDLVNFHWDPVAAAVAAGWVGTTVEEVSLSTEMVGDTLDFRRNPAGRPAHIATSIDAGSFAETWLSSIEALDRDPDSVA